MPSTVIEPRPADVEHTELAALGEERRGEGRRRVEAQRLVERHRAAEDDAIEVDVPEVDVAGREEALDEKTVAELVGRQLLRALRVWSVLHCVSYRAIQPPSTTRTWPLM